ncbi:glycine cleavage system aminomethyltransferase GcvT [Leptolyngbyaceae cyanobacterium CCMR0082]|uniref:Aminomethyltransferase n=1 Tax=Adonisia turfae CCMR0082 TaxID=2304604 RepID=A0A6M0S5A9_9CYAN|nr:glycine cleavage system aminomethyltransferase GcvT [Adonisia turfae]MDV3350311.1 glycine cleavage system aminomethyltransferase GcvT [Leptothoe sp. LEGE 181152]NEZ63657.1 glycine cleavage system aminomethyltransferase GcvT [Adonisia turfae CCMR0082]
MSLLRTPLYDLCIQNKARMTDFAGWEMPVQFSGIKQEHAAVRNQVGIFDISHMGKFILTGDHVLRSLQQLVPSDLDKLSPGKAQYTVLLNPQGGIIDDLIIYDEGEQVTLIVNAATTDKDKTWLLEHLANVELHDNSQTHALIAIQGPKAVETLQKITDIDLSVIRRYNHAYGQVLGHKSFLARTGYTGEDGFEIMVEADGATAIWQALQEHGAEPCGLGARDTLRLEASMALYGQDINDETTPLEGGLSWLVHLDKVPNFIGRDSLAQQKADGITRRLVGLQLEGRNIARHNYPIIQDDKQIGIVTSGTLSPTLGYPVALAYVPIELAKVGTVINVQIRQKTVPATVVKKPFYKAST